jgi:hypothetical protein
MPVDTFQHSPSGGVTSTHELPYRLLAPFTRCFVFQEKAKRTPITLQHRENRSLKTGSQARRQAPVRYRLHIGQSVPAYVRVQAFLDMNRNKNICRARFEISMAVASFLWLSSSSSLSSGEPAIISKSRQFRVPDPR